jgi:hypothetical protein
MKARRPVSFGVCGIGGSGEGLQLGSGEVAVRGGFFFHSPSLSGMRLWRRVLHASVTVHSLSKCRSDKCQSLASPILYAHLDSSYGVFNPLHSPDLIIGVPETSIVHPDWSQLLNQVQF